MRRLDLTLPSPEENLALDEALLDWVDAGVGSECLRWWESPRHFVVLGYSDRFETEVNAAACQEVGCPILRRCSGGGTVLQGPGCLNYALILRITDSLASLTETNRIILDRHRVALSHLTGQPIELKGSTDLVLNGLKFSGNAQRRKKHALLFHGTFLRQLNLPLLERVLPMPSRQPDYRQRRSHADFLTTLDLPKANIQSALETVWQAEQPLHPVPADLLTRVRALVGEKYGRPDWLARRLPSTQQGS
jgi:lipoate-protein ligase A